jgi:hypothetical protein
MQDESQNQQTPAQSAPLSHGNVLGMTLGELLNNNPAAQNMVMQSMNINQNQFSQMLTQAGSNPMMNMTIGDLFKNGAMGQAVQADPNQMRQFLSGASGGQQMPAQILAAGFVNPQTGQAMPFTNAGSGGAPQFMQGLQAMPVQKPSFFQKLKNFFL